MKQLVIYRNLWLRGEGREVSKLLRSSDGKQCCVGMYLLSCGVAPQSILDYGEPRSEILPAEAEWIPLQRGASTLRLYITNDDKIISAEEREKIIAQEFASQGVKVEFVDGPSA